jgi:hypothetical protein
LRREDREHQSAMQRSTHQHEQNLMENNITLSQLRLVETHGRDVLPYIPNRRQLGEGRSTTNVSGPGRVLGTLY